MRGHRNGSNASMLFTSHSNGLLALAIVVPSFKRKHDLFGRFFPTGFLIRLRQMIRRAQPTKWQRRANSPLNYRREQRNQQAVKERLGRVWSRQESRIAGRTHWFSGTSMFVSSGLVMAYHRAWCAGRYARDFNSPFLNYFGPTYAMTHRSTFCPMTPVLPKKILVWRHVHLKAPRRFISSRNIVQHG